MGTPEVPPVCTRCGGCGCEPEVAIPPATGVPANLQYRWRKQLENRPRVLELIDHYLAHGRTLRLAGKFDAKIAIDTLGAYAMAAEELRVEAKSAPLGKKDAVHTALCGNLFAAAAETVWYLASRCYPRTEEDLCYIIKEMADADPEDDPADDTPDFLK